MPRRSPLPVSSHRLALALAVPAALVACGGEGGMTPPVDTTPHIDFSSETYTLQPGEEKYLCYTTRLPADRDLRITRIVPKYGEATHHILASQTLATEPAGTTECNVLVKTTWLPFFAGGNNTNALSMPKGVGIKPLTRGHQIVMQLHLQNATTRIVQARTSLRLEYVAPEEAPTAVSIFGYDLHAIDIPPRSTGVVQSMTCQMEGPLETFAVLAHMHKLGKHFELSRGEKPGDEVLFATNWDFDDQPIAPLAVKIAAGDRVHLRCTYANPTDKTIGWGESSDTEMCAALLYNLDTGTPLNGCTM